MPQTYTRDEMAMMANHVVGENIYPDDEGYVDPEEAVWVFIEHFAVDNLLGLMHDRPEWQKWFNDEREALSEVRSEGYFFDLTENPIREPIIISFKAGRFHVWDGWHRIAAAIVSEKEYIPCILALA